MEPGYVRIFDTTLRDGEQTPGVSLTPEEKMEIAMQLDKLGVDVVEAGFPSASKGEQRAVKEIANAGLRTSVCALARALKSDIDAALQCDVKYIHTFISTSEVQMKYALNMTPEQVVEATIDAVQYIKDHGALCEFSPMDATRTDIEFLKRVCKAAEEAGADYINIPDTVGIMTPKSMEGLIRELKSTVKTPLSVHCHNDFGLAVANSLAGVEAGAAQVHVTVNGLGERAGNAALEEVVMSLHLLCGRKTGVNTQLIYETSKMISRLTGVVIQPNKAIVGENAFAHESGIHTKGVVVKPITFEPFDPGLVGRKRKLIAGKHAGKHGIKATLEETGFQPTEEQLKEIVERVKDLGDKGKTVTDADLFAIARAVMGKAYEEKIVELSDLAVVTGLRVLPTASVKLVIDGKEYVAAETGVGPVDAAIKAIQKITDSLVNVRLKEYRLEALTGGSDAIAEVIIKVEDRDGNIVSARGAREDIVMASVEAMISGINKILSRRVRLS
jgi:2-isopropylmalate synthase